MVLMKEFLKCWTSYAFCWLSSVGGICKSATDVFKPKNENTTFEECRSTISRLGENSRIIVCADSKQDDLIYKKNDASGFQQMLQVIGRMSDYFDIVNFLPQDIVRSGFVKSWILACEELGY